MPATAPSPQEPEPRDDVRRQVFLGFSLWTTAFAAVMVVAEALVHHPLHLHPLAFLGVTLVFASLRYAARRTPNVGPPACLALGTFLVALVVFERLTPGPMAGIRTALFAFPLAALLLVGQRAALIFWALAVADTTWVFLSIGFASGGYRALLSEVGAIFTGTVLLVLVWIFDRERLRAQALAAQREAELVSAVDEAHRAAEARAQFLANMSHEIRTPMNGVLGLARVLVDEELEPEPADLASTILSSGEALLGILDDILDLSKLDAGALEIDARPEQPVRILKEVVRLMSTRATDKGLELRLRIGPEPKKGGWVEVDGHRLRQVITNLISNAIKFTPSGGSVSIHLHHLAPQLKISVEDTGIGMDAPTLDTVFQPFVQAEAGTARRYGGTGLGLAICRQLCTLMGGELTAVSSPGEGSTFELSIPATETSAPSLSSDVLTAPTQGLRVLVAEDNPVNQMVIRRYLSRLHVNTRIVDNGAQAVEAVQSSSFDVVLMDLQMPEVDGIEATRQIRALEGRRSAVPIIALTASVMKAEREACRGAGMDEILAKPVDLEHLAGALNRFGPSGRERRPEEEPA